MMVAGCRRRSSVRAFMEYTQPLLTADHGNSETRYSSTDLTRTMVHRMKASDLREELERRGFTGTKVTSKNRKTLVTLLLDDLNRHHQPSSAQQEDADFGETREVEDTVDANNNNNNNNHSAMSDEGTRPPPLSHPASDSVTAAAAAATVTSEPLSATSSNISNRGDPSRIASIDLDPDRRYILRLKGLSEKSSNGTGIGIVLRDEADDGGNIVWLARQYYPRSRSLFEAEYSALALALRYAIRRFGLRNLRVQIDQTVLQNHLDGIYPVEKVSLKPMYWQIMQYKEEIQTNLSFELITKLRNAESEDLATKALVTGVSMNMGDDSIDDERFDYRSLAADPMGDYFDSQQVELPASVLQQETETGYRESSKKATSPPADFVVIDPSKTYLLQFDGGARGNPKGVAGAGMVLYDNETGREIWCGWKFLSTAVSNNQAEYSAILLGLQCAQSLGVQRIRCEGDSELIIKQLTGVYRVKNDALRELWQSTLRVMRKFEVCELKHIFREDNKRADFLCNTAMDQQASYGFDEVPVSD